MNDKIFIESPLIVKKFLGYIGTIKGKSPKTVEEYYMDLRTFFRYMIQKQCIDKVDEKTFEFGNIDIRDVDIGFIKNITLVDIFEYMEFLMKDRKNGPATRARKVASLRSFFKYLTVKSNDLAYNPIEELETPKLKKSLPKFLTLKESRMLLDSINEKGGKYKQRDWCIITLFLNCGIRLSELTGINSGDIRDDGTLRITGKGNKERILYLNDACKKAIDGYKSVRPRSGPIKDREAFFISRNNNRISPKTVQDLVKKYLLLSGLDGRGYSVHKLRHTAATLLYQHANADIRILKEILGHENMGTTEIYTHISTDQMKKSMEDNPLSKVEE